MPCLGPDYLPWWIGSTLPSEGIRPFQHPPDKLTGLDSLRLLIEKMEEFLWGKNLIVMFLVELNYFSPNHFY